MSSEVTSEVTFRISGEVMSEVVELVGRKTVLTEAVNNPLSKEITARMLDDVYRQLGKALLTKNQVIRFIGRCGVRTKEEQVKQDRFTFFVNPSDTPFLLDLLNQKAMLEKSHDEQPDPGRKGMVMWQIEKLCCRIGNVLVLKNQGVLIDRASISDKEQK